MDVFTMLFLVSNSRDYFSKEKSTNMWIEVNMVIFSWSAVTSSHKQVTWRISPENGRQDKIFEFIRYVTDVCLFVAGEGDHMGYIPSVPTSTR